jgi:peptidoglycan/xylan/chitin deacetylase (PgdA/CDA1 family)
MLRSRLKASGSRVLHWTGADRLKPLITGSAKLPVVVGYHRVVEDFADAAATSIPAMLISTRMLQEHLEWLGRHFDLISVDQLTAAMQSGQQFSSQVAVVTFDDGYADNFHNAFPVLRAQGIPAAFFIATDWLDTNNLLLHDRIYSVLNAVRVKGWEMTINRLCRAAMRAGRAGVSFRETASQQNPFALTRQLLSTLSHDELTAVAQAINGAPIEHTGMEPMTWEMVREMNRSGMTIGSHTRTHILLTNESRRRLTSELAGSRSEIEMQLGQPVRHFAFPDGRFDGRSVQAVAEAGYSSAFTICRHRDPDYPLLTIPRTLLWEKSCLGTDGAFSPSVMSCHLNGWFDFLSGCEQDHSASGRPLADSSAYQKAG